MKKGVGDYIGKISIGSSLPIDFKLYNQKT